jgi:hypothetical protein
MSYHVKFVARSADEALAYLRVGGHERHDLPGVIFVLLEDELLRTTHEGPLVVSAEGHSAAGSDRSAALTADVSIQPVSFVDVVDAAAIRSASEERRLERAGAHGNEVGSDGDRRAASERVAAETKDAGGAGAEVDNGAGSAGGFAGATIEQTGAVEG